MTSLQPTSLSENEIRSRAIQEAVAHLERTCPPGLISLKRVTDELHQVSLRMSQGMTARGSARVRGQEYVPGPDPDGMLPLDLDEEEKR